MTVSLGALRLALRSQVSPYVPRARTISLLLCSTASSCMVTQNMVTLNEEQHCNVGDDSPTSPSYIDTLERLKSLAAMPELTEEHTNEIRELLSRRVPDSACSDEDPVTPLRARLWSVMLLGLRPEDLNR